MNHGPTLLIGVLFTFGSAWLGLVFAPYAQLGGLQPVAIEGSTEVYPKPYVGDVALGRRVYIAEGCTYCHTQQIRPRGYGVDMERGWGPRRSVPRDYLYDKPHQLGTMRTGPDLFNIGARQPDANWHHLHLYDPQAIAPGSIMPPHPFLYEVRKIVGQPSKNALRVPKGWKVPPPGFEIVPTEDARTLVAYLKALDHTAPLKEAGEE